MVTKTERYITAKHHMMNYYFAWAYLLVLRVGCDIYQNAVARYRGGLRQSVREVGYQTGQQAKRRRKMGLRKTEHNVQIISGSNI